MRTISWLTQFRKDHRRELRGKHGKTLEQELGAVVSALARDERLGRRFRDHQLSGNLADFRDCHVRPDLILIYRKIGDHELQLVRLGSHAELGLA